MLIIFLGLLGAANAVFIMYLGVFVMYKCTSQQVICSFNVVIMKLFYDIGNDPELIMTLTDLTFVSSQQLCVRLYQKSKSSFHLQKVLFNCDVTKYRQCNCSLSSAELLNSKFSA